MSQATSAPAADLKVLAGGGVSVALREITAQFDAASGHKTALHFDTTPELVRQVTSGSPFDVGVVPSELFDNADAAARFAASPRPTVARAALGVAVKSGAAKPDIGTAQSLRQTLLAARSISTLPASAAGANVLKVIDRLGIAAEMKDKIRVQTNPVDVVKAVTSGDAELGVFLLSVLTAPGLDVVGPFPPEVRQDLVYVGAVSAGTSSAAAAKAFIDYLGSPAAMAVLTAKGLAPG